MSDGNNSQISLRTVLEVIAKQQPILNHDELVDKQLNEPLIGCGTLHDSSNQHLSFLANPHYAPELADSKAGVIIVPPKFADLVPKDSVGVIVDAPYLAYAVVTHLFETVDDVLSNASVTENISNNQLNSQKKAVSIHPTAHVAKSAVLADGVSVGAFCVIGENVTIASDTILQAHAYIGNGVEIGKNCLIHPHVSIAHHCLIGENVRIHAHASIGSDGFGFAPTQDPATSGWVRIAQLGRVIIGNNVRIGSQTCIDRGAINDTVIEDNVIIDNLVQIGHNVHIGAGTAIAGNAGIAGSATIGKRCMIGGAVGISGHISIADDVSLSGMTLVTKSITKSGQYASSTVAMPVMDWRRAVIKFRNMGKKNK